MPTEVRITQIKGVPDPTSNDVNKALIYTGNNTFAFGNTGTDQIASLQSSVSSLNTRVTTLENTAITTIDGGEY